MFEDHRYLAIEIAVEEVDQNRRRQTVGQGGEPAHVRQPDRRVDLLDIAAPNPPGKDALAGIVPDIGIEQGAPHPPQCSDLGNPCQRSDDRLDTGYLRVGETTGLPRCAGHRVNGAVGEDERQREIIGYPFSAKLRKDRKIHATIRVGELAAECVAGRINMRNRILEEIRTFEKLERRF
jgi:hypothetical protein